jgi:iron complex transport system ATP-binding protein
MTHLVVRSVSVQLAGRSIVEGIDLDVPERQVVGVVGPNGSGKSSLLRTIYRVLRPSTGAVLIDGRSVTSMPRRELARELAVMAQDAPPTVELCVHELVMLGRLPHQSAVRRSGPDDRTIVRDAMEAAGVLHLADRVWETLSGGERQRVLLAKAFAQRARLLVLDEPTNHLDVKHQLDLLETARSSGATVVTALHDLNLAAQYCDHVVVLARGALVAQGHPDVVLVPAVLAPVFEVEVDRASHPRTGRPWLVFSPRSAEGELAAGTRPPTEPPETEHHP